MHFRKHEHLRESFDHVMSIDRFEPENVAWTQRFGKSSACEAPHFGCTILYEHDRKARALRESVGHVGHHSFRDGVRAFLRARTVPASHECTPVNVNNAHSSDVCHSIVHLDRVRRRTNVGLGSRIAVVQESLGIERFFHRC